ncbi:class I glutamine amidotransferase-like protein [Athelia psychrophila]|uniref:D-lactate dehydratase n=1 Tax=Athelia psychrophila TaxID=1759441 RepID=A0A166VMB1_9AGAM|nr:class I glutamine amidotransferase-like protein [Fibularhizoctonia sp. CBS 109695]
MSKVLFVFTSANKTLTGAQTGWFLPEAAHPYYVLAPTHAIDFASPAGPNPEVDEGSVKSFADEESVKFLKDETVVQKFAQAKKLSDIKVSDYAAIFYIGGHGPVIDLPTDATNIKLASEFFQAGKITAAVCHGTAALLNATDSSGKSIFDGKPFTGFSNAEEEAINKVQDIPFLLEDAIAQKGGKYEKASEVWGAHVVVSGILITGQNPASAKGVGEAILKALKA